MLAAPRRRVRRGAGAPGGPLRYAGDTRRPTFATLAVLVLGPAAAVMTACGASIQAVYEGDVRFEHCMALDARPDVKPTIRRACWEEWVKFYTFGQTRDRVDYARLREKQLSTASDFDEGEWELASAKSKAVPEPTSVMAPPPMMLMQDAGAPAPSASPQADAGPAPPRELGPPSADCQAECQESWGFCRQECATPGCEKTCSGKYKRCMRRCF